MKTFLFWFFCWPLVLISMYMDWADDLAPRVTTLNA